MKINSSISSLVPYLSPKGTNFYLRISLSAGDSEPLGNTSSPFVIIDDAAPFHRIIEAHLLTDAGSRAKRLHLAVQKDTYQIPRDDLWPISNRDIDHCWRKAFSFYSGKDLEGAPIFLGNQLNEKMGFRAFGSLFYCKERDLFFHPPCPDCGLPLQPCHDDGLLSHSGLQPYGSSLRRYLFCPSCLKLGKQGGFYAASTSPDDPPDVVGLQGLISAFGRVPEEPEGGEPFPCPQCNHREMCYGTDGKALLNLAPFAFYPFFMLIFEAASVNAVDFLPFISGASFEDVEKKLRQERQHGRIKCLIDLKRQYPKKTTLFSEDYENAFLEVLFLKLAFLTELMHTRFHGSDGDCHPDFGLVLNNIWVNLDIMPKFLPNFWNFRLNIIEIGENLGDRPSLPRLPLSSSRYVLGLTWFYVLLVNRRQGVAAVYAALARIASIKDVRVKDLKEEGFEAVFSPENIFWMPDEKVVPRKWLGFWEEALDLGLMLLGSGLHGDPQWSNDRFGQALEQVTEKIKECLFMVKIPDVLTEEKRKTEAIHDILERILKKWTSEFGLREGVSRGRTLGKEPVLKRRLSQRSQVDEDPDKTIIISPMDGRSASVGRNADGEPTSAATEERIREGKNLSLQRETDRHEILRDSLGTAENPPASSLMDQMEKTVIIAAEAGLDADHEEGFAENDQEDVDETFILSSSDTTTGTACSIGDSAGIESLAVKLPDGPTARSENQARDGVQDPSQRKGLTEGHDPEKTIIVNLREREKVGP